MNRHIRTRLASMLALSVITVAPFAPPAQAEATLPAATQAATSNWREDYAYTLGMQAYVFSFPWLQFQKLYWKWVTQPATRDAEPYAAVNHFWHGRKPIQQEYRDGGAPNTNLLYSVGIFDVSREPLIVSVPKVDGERYWTMEFVAHDMDNFAYIGRRTTGSGGGNYAVVGPNWHGKLPPGVKALPVSRSNQGFIYGRTLFKDANDLAIAHRIQDQYQLTPLSLWGRKGAVVPETHEAWQPFDSTNDPLGEWKSINRALADAPPIARHAPLLAQYAGIGVGPGLDIEAQDEASRRGLERAARDGRALMQRAFRAGYGKRVNNWIYPPNSAGRAGLQEDFLSRAIFAMFGNGINDPEESVYLHAVQDGNGQPLAGSRHYTWRLDPKDLPKVDSYWSLTLYDPTNNLHPNPLRRYTFASYELDKLKRDADGGITFHVGAASPGAESESNWLPAPEGSFWLVLRAYLPQKDILDQTWVPPTLVPVP